uniref:Uncharacterized protein n=1 Tax=Cyprinus carpio TaxID=7962 RepID=A0A8C2FJ55_CYPCA
MYTLTGLIPDAEYQFRVIAQNDVGQSEPGPVSESVVYKPGQPGEFDIISITKDSITIHWLRPESDGGKEILGYWIEYRQAGESAWKKCNKERSKDRQFTMGGLMEATEYEFRVFAENETGLSRPRRTAMGIKTKLSCTTIPSWIPIEGEILCSSVIISWKPPKDDGGSMITNYIVEKCEAKEGEQWHLVSSAISGTTCRVPNLTESAGYYFRVSAQNQYGISEPLEIPSVVIIKSPFGKFHGLPFVSSVTKDSCVVSWKAPTSDGGAKIKNYYLEKREKKQNKWIAVTTEEIHETTYTVKGLLEGFEYEFRVKCENIGGESDWSEISEPVIPKSDTALRAPFFKEELRDMCVKYRATATFVTKVIGHPSPVVKWYKNGKEILPDGEKIKVQEFKGGYFQLVISNADENDVAVYQIRATNQLGSISKSMNLEVEGNTSLLSYDCFFYYYYFLVPAKIHLPLHLQGMGAVHAIRGEVVTIKIPISGKPDPVVTWQKGQEMINNTAYHQVIITRSFTSLVFLKGVQRKDSGYYIICVIKTLRHRRYYQSLVKREWSTVISAARVAYGGGYRNQRNVSIGRVKVGHPEQGLRAGPVMHCSAEEGGHIRFVCCIENYNRNTEVTWYFGSRKLTASHKYEISCANGVASIYVKDIEECDDGLYRCKVVCEDREDNAYAEHTTSEKLVSESKIKESETTSEVSVKKVKATLSAKILTKPQSLTVSEGDSARFVCDIDGEPAPSVTWMHEGRTIVSSHRIHVSTTQYKSTFEISSVEYSDEGSYTVVVENSEGKQEARFTLTIHKQIIKVEATPTQVKALCEIPSAISKVP